MCVDENQQDTNEEIVFSEWSFPFNDMRIQRKDFSFREMLNRSAESEDIRQTGQLSLFANAQDEIEPTLLRQYITDYRRLGEDGE